MPTITKAGWRAGTASQARGQRESTLAANGDSVVSVWVPPSFSCVHLFFPSGDRVKDVGVRPVSHGPAALAPPSITLRDAGNSPEPHKNNIIAPRESTPYSTCMYARALSPCLAVWLSLFLLDDRDRYDIVKSAPLQFGRRQGAATHNMRMGPKGRTKNG
jgi:hypothetical protein